MLKENKYYSYNKGELANGCKLCVQGRKLVLFISGLCSKNCWYCPIADHKYKKDVIYANERKIENEKEILEEIKDSDARGAGITGGDPILVLERTANIIKMLKKEFGPKFHIHLYSPLENIREDKLKKLFEVGLDEIRIHPDLENKKDWNKRELIKKFDWSVGLEIPLIPGKKEETKELLNYFKDKVDFINLNELEGSNNSTNKVFEKGYKNKDELSYAIKDSVEEGLELIDELNLERVHLCTVKLKDTVQLGNRLKVRSEHTKSKLDIVTEEGSLIRGAIYFEKPSFNYTENLKSKNKEEEIKKLKKLKTKICVTLKINKQDIAIDEVKYRLLTSRRIISRRTEEIKKLGLIPAIVEEYPTYDLFEVEIEFL